MNTIFLKVFHKSVSFVHVIKYVLTLLTTCFLITNSIGQSRQTISFNSDWFFKLDSVNQHIHDYTKKDWRKLTLPHDWSIEMPFREKSLANSGAAYLDGGIGWYKKEFYLPKNTQGKRVFIEFDGVYENSEVWINGHYLGKGLMDT